MELMEEDMVRVEYIDGKSEEFVTVENEYSYDKRSECFQIQTENGYADFPRDFVKSIRVVED